MSRKLHIELSQYACQDPSDTEIVYASVYGYRLIALVSPYGYQVMAWHVTTQLICMSSHMHVCVAIGMSRLTRQ